MFDSEKACLTIEIHCRVKVIFNCKHQEFVIFCAKNVKVVFVNSLFVFSSLCCTNKDLGWRQLLIYHKNLLTGGGGALISFHNLLIGEGGGGGR